MNKEASPEKIEYGGFWIRFLASIIDSVLITLLIMPLGFLLLKNQSVYQGLINFFISWIFPAVVVVIFWIYKSATPGKTICSLVIVDADHLGQPGTKNLIVRYLAYYVSLLPLALGFFWVGFDPKKQGWHDKLSNTVVIKKSGGNSRRKTLFKIIIAVVLAVGFLIALTVAGGVYWFSQNKDKLTTQFGEAAMGIRQDAEEFGRENNQQGCMDEALGRLDACDGFGCKIKNNIFLIECLKQSEPTPGFCDGVPRKTEFMKTVSWRLNQCSRLGRDGNFCHELFGTVQRYCYDADRQEHPRKAP